jgi:peptidoglycan hydrolase CwlO-like protein
MKTKKQYMQLKKSALVNLLIAKDGFMNMLGKDVNESKREIERLQAHKKEVTTFENEIQTLKNEVYHYKAECEEAKKNTELSNYRLTLIKQLIDDSMSSRSY